MQSETLVEEFSRLVREYNQDDGPGGIEAWNLIADFAVDNAEAIEAALSAAEPVGWHIPGSAAITKDKDIADRWRLGNPSTVIYPVYTSPPATAVAVKELQWDEDGENLKARMGDREWMLNITSDGKTWAGSTPPFVFGRNLTWSSVPNCSMVSLEAAKAACQADCQSRYAALSAQVQDVAQYSGPCSLDEFVSALFSDGAHHVDMKNALDEWLNQDYSEALSYLDNKTRSRLLPAAAARVKDVAGTVEAFDRDHPELYWHIAKGKIAAGEPLYGAIITDLRGKELGHGESDASAVDAFNIAVASSSLPAAPAKQEG